MNWTVAQSLCQEMGFRLVILQRWQDVPNVGKQPREFEDVLHVRDTIWVSTDLAGTGAVWHEIGHAMAAYLLGPKGHQQMLERGEHWIVDGTWVSDEDPACSAAHALATVAGVPGHEIEEMNRLVLYRVERDTERDRWMQMAEDAVSGCGVSKLRSRYRDLGSHCRKRSQKFLSYY